MESHLLGRVETCLANALWNHAALGLELEPLVLAEAKWETGLEHLQTGPTRGS